RAGGAPGSVHGGDAGDPRRADRRGDRLALRAGALAVDEAEPHPAAAQRLEAARRARRPRGGARLVTPHAEPHHGPPIANQSSRVDAPTLGMLLFIASEVMLFGSFFTIYFFARVVAGPAEWPPPPFHLPVFVAGVNTAILITSSFTMHWALQANKRGNRAGMQAGLVLTVALGLTFLLTQIREYSRVGFSPQDGAFGSTFYGLTGLHGAHVFVGLTILTFATIRAFRGHFTARGPRGVEILGIYWHFVDVMWIVVYTTVYIL